MRFINILPLTLLVAALLNTNNTFAQTWNLTGNAGIATSNFLGTSDAKDLKIKTNNTVRMFVKSNGLVGIGTSAPAALLHIQKTSLSEALIRSTGAGSQLTIDRSANGYDAVTRYTQTGIPQWKTGLIVNANGTPDYVIKNEINNSDALSISGSSNFVTIPSGILTLGTSNASSIQNSGLDLKMFATAPSNGSVSPAGNVILAYPSNFFKSGNVAIGTDDASLAKFTVRGYVGQNIAMFRRASSSAGITITADWPEIYFNSYYINGVKAMKAGYGGLMGVDPTSGNMYFRTGSASAANDNDPLSFNDNMVIDRLGNVGIGTFPSTYKLNVCGTIRANEVRVSTGWCDYVFADDYQLPALSDVENFIKENKHLPEVTPGAIIESEGLEIGKTSAQMIKKIEELTLYVIDLQKQVNELKKSNK